MKFGYYLSSQAQEVTEGTLQVIGLSPEGMGEVCQVLPGQVADAEHIFADI